MTCLFRFEVYSKHIHFKWAINPGNTFKNSVINIKTLLMVGFVFHHCNFSFLNHKPHVEKPMDLKQDADDVRFSC